MDSHSPTPPAPEYAGPQAAAAMAPPAQRRRPSNAFIITMGACAAAVIGLGSIAGAATFATVVAHAAAANQASKDRSSLEQALYGNGNSTSSGTSGGQSSLGDGTSGSDSSSGQEASDSLQVGVVTIDTVLSYQGAQAAGTGMVLTSDGEILTNNHVVAGATAITVTVLSTGDTYKASVVGTDATDDVAVLKLANASGLKTATIDDSGDVNVGDQVTAVGNAGGTGTLTSASGAVTDLDQTITTQAEGSADSETLHGLIETNADIEAGDSGGPLYDADSEIVGINTAASVGSSQTQGYAIPIEDALAIAKQIESGQETDSVSIGYPAFLGIEVGSSDGSALGNGGYSSGSLGGSTAGSVTGAPVAGVIADGPAAAAGIVAGDTITAVDGTSISSASALTSALASYEPGQTAAITWTDSSGQSHSASVTFAAGPAA